MPALTSRSGPIEVRAGECDSRAPVRVDELRRAVPPLTALPLLQGINTYLVRWARRKYPRYLPGFAHSESVPYHHLTGRG